MTNDSKRAIADPPTTLEETVALLESILEASHDAILVIDLDGRVVRCNLRFLAMLRLTTAQLERSGSDAIVAAINDQLQEPRLLLANSRQLRIDPSTEAVDLVRFKDGRVYRCFVAPHRVNGAVVGQVASYCNITKRDNAQQALERHRAFLEKAQEVAHIGSWVAELDGSDRLAWSGETHRIFGVERDAFSGTTAEFLSFVHPDDLDFVRRASDAAIANERPYEVEHRIVLKDRIIRWVNERADIARDENGKALRMVGIVQDITDRRLLEEQLRQSQKLEAIGRLAGGIAHDLNNALTAIVGYTELALGSLNKEHPAAGDVSEIRRAAERAESVTRQLLAFSRKQMVEPRLFSLGDVVVSLGRLLDRLLGVDIEVKTVVGDQLPPIYGDPRQIEQTIINLAVNARDAMPRGGSLTLALSVVDCDEASAHTHRSLVPGRYVELSVTDTGEGMDAETQAHVFEPFFTTKEVGKGTGLGMAIVYGTVRQSGGCIFVESEIGHGSTFRLYFPDVSAQHTMDATPPTHAPTGNRPTILVVEDEPAVRNLVVSTLSDQGYRVLYASCGEEALAIADADRGNIDLLLTDAKMPGMNGIHLANALVRKRPGLPVVVMSGFTEEALTIEGTARTIPLLSKPFTPRELRQKVAEILGHVERPTDTSGPP